MIRWLFGDLATEVSLLRSAIRGLAMSNRRPVVWVRLSFKESNMALVYSVSAGSAVDADVITRELTVVVNGEQVAQNTFSGSETALGEVVAPQGGNVMLTLVDIDDAGNRSQPATVEFVAVDTIQPAQPGSFGVTLVREE